MPSTLQVDSIKDKSDTKTLATLSSSAVTLDPSVVFPAGGTGNPISVAVIADEKAYNVDGGSSSTGSFITRDLNTVISDTEASSGGIVSIASNQFTLGAGTYQISWSCPAMKADRHTTHLYDITGTDFLQEGSSEYCSDSDASVQTRSIGSFIHTITSNNIYEIRQRFGDAQSTDGLGVAHDYSGYNNIYLIVSIYKLK